MTPEESYRATVHELQALARRAPHVTQDDVREIASMPADELRRRAIRGRDWHGHFSHCLDGLPELQRFGAAPDGCWMPDTVRRVVEALLAERAALKRQLQPMDQAAARSVSEVHAPKRVVPPGKWKVDMPDGAYGRMPGDPPGPASVQAVIGGYVYDVEPRTGRLIASEPPTGYRLQKFNEEMQARAAGVLGTFNEQGENHG